MRACNSYALNVQHPKGTDKAILSRKRLGITLENKQLLETALLKSVIENEAIIYKTDQYGIQYDVKFSITTEVGSSLVLGYWIIRTNEDVQRLTNTYPIGK